jgi:hypothetical protein
MTRSKTKQSVCRTVRARAGADESAAPIEWTSVPFPVKALKIVLADLQGQGTAGTVAARAEDADLDSGSEVRAPCCLRGGADGGRTRTGRTRSARSTRASPRRSSAR